MIDIIATVYSITLLLLSIAGVLALIPLWVTAATRSESDPDHIYNFFQRESGRNGHKLLSPIGCLLPFVALANEVIKPEALIMSFTIAVACGAYHSSVYRGYKILSNKMIAVGIIALCVLTATSQLVRASLIPGYVIFWSAFFGGIAWGSYAVYKRASLIKADSLSRH